MKQKYFWLNLDNWQKEKVLLEKKKIDNNPTLLEDWDKVKQQLTRK